MKGRPESSKLFPLTRDCCVPWTVALTAGAICLLVFLRALSCGFVNYDDTEYVLDNLLIRQLDLDALNSIFTELSFGFWMPLTWISLAIDYHFWGLNPFGYHLTNIVLHAINTGLVVLVSDMVLKRRHVTSGDRNWSYLYPCILFSAALLWGIHPLRVESVAWVTERKDVLNGFFAISSAWTYLRFAERKASAVVWWPSYLFSLVLFTCSLLAKSVTVGLPLMFLVLDFYPLGRLRWETLLKMVLEKLPFFVVSGLFSAFTMLLASYANILVSNEQLGYGMRLIIAGNAIFEYVRLMLIPVGIFPLYIIPNPIPYLFAVKAGLALVTVGVCLSFSRNRPWISALWMLFVIPLLPVLGLLQNGDQAYAARFTYLPAISVSIASAMVIGSVYQRIIVKVRTGWVVLLLFPLLFVTYGYLTNQQIDVWKDSGSMWSRVIARQPFDKAYFFRGLYYADSGNYLAAIDDYSKCLAIVSQENINEMYRANILAFRGEAFTKSGQYDSAFNDFSSAIEISPRKQFYYYRGLALKGMGRFHEAEDDFLKAGYVYGQMEWVPF